MGYRPVPTFRALGGSAAVRTVARTSVVALVALVTAAVPATTGLASGPGGSGGSGETSSGSALHPRQLPKPVAGHGRKAAPQYAPDHVLVRFKSGTSAARQGAGVRAAGGTALRPTGAAGITRVLTAHVVTSLRSLQKDPTVAWAGYDYVRHASDVPNDPGYQPSFQQPYLDQIQLTWAWSRTTGSLSQVVAVVDSGVDSTAPDLAGRVLAGEHFLLGGASSGPGANPAAIDGTCPDPAATGHGTFVASVAAADTNNGYGIAGAAWNARILPVRVLDACGSGYDSDVAAGVTWAADHGATVINLSLGGTDPAPTIQAAMQYANGKGIPVIVAAGNDGSSVAQYPAAYPEAIAVAATDSNGHLTWFSSFGDWVDIAAPGWNILGEEPRALCADSSDPHPTDCYYTGAGTSFAAPLVAGVMALMRTEFPSLTPAQLQARLQQSARDDGPAGIDPFYGFGLLDAYAAVGGPRTTPVGAMRGMMGGHWPGDPMAVIQPTFVYTQYIDLEGAPRWYSLPTTAAATQEHFFVAPTPGQPSTTNPAPQVLEPVLRVYDAGHHLLATSVGDSMTHQVNFDTVLPAGTNLFSVSNANGSTPDYQMSVTDTGTGVAVTAGQLEWVRNVQPLSSVTYSDITTPSTLVGVHPTVAFDRAMSATTFTPSTVVLRSGTTGSVVPSTVSYDGPTRTLTVTPDASLELATSYSLTVNGGSPSAPVTDTSGNVMPEMETGFTTVFGVTQPLTGVTASGSPWGAYFSWDRPQGGDFSAVELRYNKGLTPPVALTGTGTLAYDGSYDSATVTGLVPGTDYAFLLYNVDTYSRVGWSTYILRGTTTTLAASPAAPVYSAATTVTATVRTLDGQPVAGQTVKWYSRRTGTTTYYPYGTATTTAAGQVSINPKPGYNTQYEAVAAGEAGFMGSYSVLSLPVRFNVTVAGIPATTTVGKVLHFTGAVAPARPGGRVLLEGYWANTWHLLAYGTLSATSHYSFTVTPARASTYIYRVYKEPDTLLGYGATASYRMAVT